MTFISLSARGSFAMESWTTEGWNNQELAAGRGRRNDIGGVLNPICLRYTMQQSLDTHPVGLLHER